jgi:hypothetical protein
MKRLIEILKTYDTEPVELFNSAVMFYLGIALLCPGSTFNSTNLTYAVMAHVMPEDAWAILFLLTGAAGILGVSLNIRKWRFCASVLKMLVYLSMGVLYYLANPLTTGGTYAILGMAAGWCAVRRIVK